MRYPKAHVDAQAHLLAGAQSASAGRARGGPSLGSRGGSSARPRLTGVVLALTLWIVGCGDGESAAQTAEEEGAAAVPEEEVVDLTNVGHDEVVEGAVIQVVEFSDFGCVHCADFHTRSYPDLYEEFVVAGDVAWKYVPVTIGGFPNGDAAAVAAECAAQQGEWTAMRDRLFQVRDRWMQADDAVEVLVEEAAGLGLEADSFRACLEEDEAARERVAEGNRAAQSIGVRATPTFFVQGHPVEGAPPLEQFQDVLRRLVAEARGGGGSDAGAGAGAEGGGGADRDGDGDG